MSREGRRVEPVPSPFELSDAAARRSPLYGRVVFLTIVDEKAARSLLNDLQERPDVQVGPGPSRLFVQGVLHLWGAFQLVSDVGQGALVSAADFLTLLRRLADDLLSTAVSAGEVLVEWSPEHASERSLSSIRSLYPDAVIVAEPAPADEILSRLPAAADHAPETPRQSMQDRLIVIVGAGRSGTTWLEELLLSYDDMGGLSGHETWLFHSLQHLWRNFNGDDAPGLSSWIDRDDFIRALRRYCDGILASAQQRHSPHARFYIEKTPVHVERLPEIAAIYPDAWVIHLVRDGRDVARSMSQVSFFDVADPADAAALWQRVMRRARIDAPAVPRFREVRYEDLHDDPVRVLHDIRAWVGATPNTDPPALDDAINRRVSTHAGTANKVGQGSWRTLPPSTLADIYAAAGDELVRAGYASRGDIWRARLRRRALLGQRSRKSRTTDTNAAGSSTQGK